MATTTTITANPQSQKFQNALLALKDVQNNGGSLRGERRNPGDKYLPSFGRLAHSYGALDAFEFDVVTNVYGVDYIVYSYGTPIAWHTAGPDEGRWRMVNYSWSSTTGKHQSRIWPIRNTPGFKWVGQRELSQILTPAQIRTLLLIGDFPAGVPLFDGHLRRSANIVADRHPSILQRDFWADGTPWFVLMPEIAERLGKPAPLPGLAHATSMSGVLL